LCWTMMGCDDCCEVDGHRAWTVALPDSDTSSLAAGMRSGRLQGPEPTDSEGSMRAELPRREQQPGPIRRPRWRRRPGPDPDSDSLGGVGAPPDSHPSHGTDESTRTDSDHQPDPRAPRLGPSRRCRRTRSARVALAAAGPLGPGSSSTARTGRAPPVPPPAVTVPESTGGLGPARGARSVRARPAGPRPARLRPQYQPVLPLRMRLWRPRL
jgi:hypothetical protein